MFCDFADLVTQRKGLFCLPSARMKLTVMFIRTFLLKWSKRTVTDRSPASSTTTDRGKRKKATSEDTRRQSRTERPTYSFLRRQQQLGFRPNIKPTQNFLKTTDPQLQHEELAVRLNSRCPNIEPWGAPHDVETVSVMINNFCLQDKIGPI